LILFFIIETHGAFVVGFAVVVHLGSLAVAAEHENFVVSTTGGRYVGFGVGACVGAGFGGAGGAGFGGAGFGGDGGAGFGGSVTSGIG
jgi:hypothetical protein